MLTMRNGETLTMALPIRERAGRIIEDRESESAIAGPETNELFARCQFKPAGIIVVENRGVLLAISLDPTDEGATMGWLPPGDRAASCRGCPIKKTRIGFDRVAVVDAGSVESISQTKNRSK